MNSQPHSILMMTQDLQLMNEYTPTPSSLPNKHQVLFFFFFLFQFCDINFLVNFPHQKIEILIKFTLRKHIHPIFFPNFFVGKMIEFVQNNPPSLTPEDFLVDSGMGMRLLGRV